jgi:hypothetical protein
MQAHGHNGNARGIGEAAREAAEHASAVARLELRLAAIELKDKATALGVGIGLAATAAVLGVLVIALAVATVVAALTTVLDTWLAFLVVTGAVAIMAGMLAGLAVMALRRGARPIPHQALEEARLTTHALRGNGR